LLGNKIDRALRLLNDGQTIGIPIGPDTSLLAAEMLLAAIDQALLAKFPRFTGFRYVDDYELSFPTLSDAEAALAELQGMLYAYELSLNPRKTRIVELPQSISDSWAVELARFVIREKPNPVGQRNDILSLFSRAYELAVENPEDPILRYSIARVQNVDMAIDGWRSFQNCVLGAGAADASALHVALGTLYQVSAKGGHAIAKSPLAEVFEKVVANHAPKGHGSEVAWALWGALAWKVPLTAATASLVSNMDDDIVALLALDADASLLFPNGALNKQNWTAIANLPDVLKSEHWLLAYEGHCKGWLNCPSVAAHAEFSGMHNAGVSFYDRAQNIPQFPPGARSLSGGDLANNYA